MSHISWDHKGLFTRRLISILVDAQHRDWRSQVNTVAVEIVIVPLVTNDPDIDRTANQRGPYRSRSIPHKSPVFSPFSPFTAVSLCGSCGTFPSFPVHVHSSLMFQAFRSLLTVSFNLNFSLSRTLPSIFISTTAQMFSVSSLLDVHRSPVWKALTR